MINRVFAAGACAVVLSALGGCATTPEPRAAAPAPVAAPRQNASAAVALLYKGDAAGARQILVQLLAAQPDNTRAKSLLQQIDTPPETLLGKDSFAYKVRSQDTLSLLAQRFLGDPTLFYALARYNSLTLPTTLEPGQVLRIPGHEKPQPTRSPAPPARATPKTAEPAPTPAPRAAAPPPTAKRAVELRAAGLEQLNRGEIDKAVALLQQALQNDPGNALIKRDLDRALRISATVRAKP